MVGFSSDFFTYSSDTEHVEVEQTNGISLISQNKKWLQVPKISLKQF